MELTIKYVVTLKSRALKKVLIRKGIELVKVAQSMNISMRAFRKRLYLRQGFNQEEITTLIKLIGARAAIEIIWFPTLEEKKWVEQYVWEKQSER